MTTGTPTGFFFESRWKEHLLTVVTESVVVGGLYLSDVVGPEWAMALMAGTELVMAGMHTVRCPRKGSQEVVWEEELIEIDYGTPRSEVHARAVRTRGDGELQFSWYSSDGEEITQDGKLPARDEPYQVEAWAKATPRFDESRRVRMEVRVLRAKQVVRWDEDTISVVYGTTLREIKQHAQLDEGEGTLCFSHEEDDRVLPCQGGKAHLVKVWAEETDNYLESEKAGLSVVVEKAPQTVRWPQDSVTIVHGTDLSKINNGAERVEGDGPLHFSHGDDVVLGCKDSPYTLQVWAEETDDYLESEKAALTVIVEKAPQRVRWPRDSVTVVFGTKPSEINKDAEHTEGDGTLRFSHEDDVVLGCNGSPYTLEAWAEETDDYLESKKAVVTVLVEKAPQTVRWPQDSVTIVHGTDLSEINNGAERVEGDGPLHFSHGDDVVLGCKDSPYTLQVWAEETDDYLESEKAVLTVRVDKAPQELAWGELQPVHFGVTLGELPQPQRIKGDGELVFEHKTDTGFEAVLADWKPPVTGSPHTIRAKLAETDDYLESPPVEATLVVNVGEQELTWTVHNVYLTEDHDPDPDNWSTTFAEVPQPERVKGDGQIQVRDAKGKVVTDQTVLSRGAHRLRARVMKSSNCDFSPIVEVTVNVLFTVPQWMVYLGYEEKTNIWMRGAEAVDDWQCHFTVFKADLPSWVTTLDDTWFPLRSTVLAELFPSEQFHVTLEYFPVGSGRRQPRYMRDNDNVWFGDVPEHHRDQLNTRTRRKMLKELLTNEIKRLKGLIAASGVTQSG